MRLVIGLGNPGKEYDGTRHNVGFEVVDAIAEKLGWVGKGQFNRMAKTVFDGLAVDGMLNLMSKSGTEKVVLLKPMTYMNDSGRSVSSALNYFKLTPAEVIVIVDEMALPCGQIRLRPDGSDGGHNGLKSVQQMLGTNRYPRLRMGVDLPPPYMQGRDYVLGRFTAEQRPKIDSAVNKACGCVTTWIDEGVVKAMNVYNAVVSGQ
ncbi:MAG: aminoacyl-tRNA hydrolase [Tepidisphaeraceae bacterium]